MKKKVVLAYSGGLDTSCCIGWLKERGFEVICFIADLGQGEDFDKIEARALSAGAAKVYVKNLQNEFVDRFVLPSLKAGAIYEGKYLLATALGRPLIAKYLVEVARREKSQYAAHGCTGKGNDQVRLELSIAILNPKLEIIAPLRQWGFKSREEEIEYAKRRNIDIDVTKKKPYSIDRNIWGVSIEAGVLEDLEKEAPEDAYLLTKNPACITTAPKYIEIYFEKGIPRRLNGKAYKFIDIIEVLNKIGGSYGIGRADLVENRLVGIKSREIYEAPAATIFYTAHKELESLVLDRECAHFKQQVALKYSELVYYGLWFSPLKEALDSFVNSSQRQVTGSVRLKLSAGSCVPAGRRSPNSLYKKKLATYGKEDEFDQKLAEGFIKIWGMPYRR